MAYKQWMHRIVYEFPTIIKAAIIIAYDNGMVDRHTLEEEQVEMMIMRTMGKFSPAEFKEAEDFLKVLDESSLYDLCADGSDGTPEFIDRFLNTLFG